MNDKTKKRLVVAGGLVVCLVLITGISSQFKAEKQEDTTASAGSTQVAEVSVEPVSETSESEKEVVVTVPASTTARQTEETLPVQTDLSEQKIQPDVTKPAATQPATQATTKAPATEGSKEETTAAAETQATTPETSVQLPTSPAAETEQKTEEGKAQGGDTQNGKIYVPGFGWIDEIGEAQGSTAEDMYENGNKIGIYGLINYKYYGNCTA